MFLPLYPRLLPTIFPTSIHQAPTLGTANLWAEVGALSWSHNLLREEKTLIFHGAFPPKIIKHGDFMGIEWGLVG
jgi:hypothetical protein